MPTKDDNGIILPDMGELTPDYQNQPVVEYLERSMLATPGKVRLVSIDYFAVVNTTGDPYSPKYDVARVSELEKFPDWNGPALSKYTEEDEAYDELYRLDEINKILNE